MAPTISTPAPDLESLLTLRRGGKQMGSRWLQVDSGMCLVTLQVHSIYLSRPSQQVGYQQVKLPGLGVHATTIQFSRRSVPGPFTCDFASAICTAKTTTRIVRKSQLPGLDGNEPRSLRNCTTLIIFRPVVS